MKKELILVGCSVLFLAGCSGLTNEQILDEANITYSRVSERYDKILNSDDNIEVVNNCIGFAQINNCAMKTKFSNHCKDYSSLTSIAPLHKTCCIICDDVKLLKKGISYLQKRKLDNSQVYKNMQNFQNELGEIMAIVLNDDKYMREEIVLQREREAGREYSTLGKALIMGFFGIPGIIAVAMDHHRYKKLNPPTVPVQTTYVTTVVEDNPKTLTKTKKVVSDSDVSNKGETKTSEVKEGKKIMDDANISAKIEIPAEETKKITCDSDVCTQVKVKKVKNEKVTKDLDDAVKVEVKCCDAH